MALRRALHALGYRYRLHVAALPGKPDIVFPSRRKAVFVHGCFWHGHDCPRGARMPKTNVAYWSAKLERNRNRDTLNKSRLTEQGWRSLVVWECEFRQPDALIERVRRFLED